MEVSNFSLDENTTTGCGCAICQNYQPELITYGQDDFQFQTTDSPTYAPSGVADPNTFANYLTHGFWEDRGGSARSWSQDTITFSLSNGYTAIQKEGLRMALDLWSDVADIQFSGVSSGADMSFVVGSDGGAYSSSSTSGGTILSNTISIDTSVGGWSSFNTLGNYALMTAIHEIGHSLGLGHTGNYNGSATYNNDAQWTNDTHQTTVMSYFSDTNVGSDHWNSTGGWKYSSTPMLIDILAIQNIYGADYTTRNGNTTYGFNSNADRDQYDFSISEVPIAIWDGGGIDTLDLSGYVTNQTIYLTEGYFSSTGNMTNNLVIAYGAVIENAIGGLGNDTIYGNDVDNIILGGAGNDTFYSSEGSDTIDGGADSDVITYVYSVTDFAYNFISNTTVALTHLLNNFTDTVLNIENFIFSDGSFTFAELETTYGQLETVAVRLFWDVGLYRYNSDENGSITVNATNMGYDGATGDQISITRLGATTTVTILDINAPNIIKLYGTAGNDTLVINGTHNNMIAHIYGGSGNDTITVEVVGDDRIYGEAGDDIIDAGDGNDIIYGGAGNDEIYGGSENDRLYGMDDNDEINGELGNDFIDGGNGNDHIIGELGSDRLYGGNGDDIISGGDGRDKIYGGMGFDLLLGGNDKDYIYGGADDDQLFGEAGNDAVYGQDGIDILNGGLGHDRLDGGAGNDILHGNEDNDALYGGADDDILIGGAGFDLLYGQDGADIFGFTILDGNVDQIRDFSLTGIYFDALNVTDVLSGYNEGTSDINDFVIINYKSADRADLFINADGAGNDWEQAAIIRGSDFTGITVDTLKDAGLLIADTTPL